MHNQKTEALQQATNLSHEIDEHGKSLWFYAWRRLKQNKLAFDRLQHIGRNPCFHKVQLAYLEGQIHNLPVHT